MPRLTRSAIGAIALVALLGACGDDDEPGVAAQSCQPADADLRVAGDDRLSFDAESYDADAGCVEITLVNEGVIAHTLLVEGYDGFKLSVGKSDSDRIELAAGTYRIFCDIAGHEAAGMEAELVVG